jgi:hypothetical protein
VSLASVMPMVMEQSTSLSHAATDQHHQSKGQKGYDVLHGFSSVTTILPYRKGMEGTPMTFYYLQLLLSRLTIR